MWKGWIAERKNREKEKKGESKSEYTHEQEGRRIRNGMTHTGSFSFFGKWKNYKENEFSQNLYKIYYYYYTYIYIIINNCWQNHWYQQKLCSDV